MRRYFGPATVLAVIVVFNLALAVTVVWLATAQPWLGVRLAPGPTGDVIIDRVAEKAVVPQRTAGARLVSLGAAGNTVSDPGAPPVLFLDTSDIIEEPDMLGSADLLSRFFTRQDRMFRILDGGNVTLVLERDGLQESLPVSPRAGRRLADLPAKLWLQLLVAVTGGVIGAWVVCLRPRDGAAWMFLVAGIGLAMASGSAALYSARELALAGPVFATASRLNSSGTLIFGIGMVTLFLIYPRRILPRPVLWIPAVVLGSGILAIQLLEWPRYVGAMQDLIAAVMVVLLAAIGAQVVVNRRDPAARAMLGWLGLSIAAGAGGFVLTSPVPTLLGVPVLLEQSTAFLFFLLIYAGIAMGVLRYRLFDLATWSFGILFYGLGVALLLVLDAVLIYGLSLDQAPALGIALATVGIVYLPMRAAAARWLRRDRALSAEALYQRVTDIAHAMDPQHQQAMLISFWSDLFTPLKITPVRGAAGGSLATALGENGAWLTLAPVARLPGLRLDWAAQGTRLFSSADLSRARALNAMIARTLQQHNDYLEAVAAERSRINRDMHDNIGILLLGALHANTSERKNLLIRQTLYDLREIISNPDQSGFQLPELVADLRAEIVGHLEAAEIGVNWRDHGLPDVFLRPQVVHTLRSFLRESTSNIVRHSAAHEVVIDLSAAGDALTVSVSDDGLGFDADTVQAGNGFRNLGERVTQMGGTFDLAGTPAGTRIRARLPLSTQLSPAGVNATREGHAPGDRPSLETAE